MKALLVEPKAATCIYNPKRNTNLHSPIIMSSLVNPSSLLTFQLLFAAGITLVLAAASEPNKLFREYIGAEGNNVTFSYVPINPNVEFHFILSFAIDYTNSSSPPRPTNGDFEPYWDTQNLSPSHISSIKSSHPNVKVALSLGGDTIAKHKVFFKPTSINSWLRNAIHSITQLVQSNHLDGIDIDYEHFDADPDTFADCIGKLIYYLKQSTIVSFASIAPYDDGPVQSHYLALWRKYGHLIDYVNFQFYAYPKVTTKREFVGHFERQVRNYRGGKVLVSFGTDNSGGLKPEHGFFDACAQLSRHGKLHGIFIWSADDSKKFNFRYEVQSQTLLTTAI